MTDVWCRPLSFCHNIRFPWWKETRGGNGCLRLLSLCRPRCHLSWKTVAGVVKSNADDEAKNRLGLNPRSRIRPCACERLRLACAEPPRAAELTVYNTPGFFLPTVVMPKKARTRDLARAVHCYVMSWPDYKARMAIAWTADGLWEKNKQRTLSVARDVIVWDCDDTWRTYLAGI